MDSEIRMHDVVALLEEFPATHAVTGAPLTLRRGQIGTVVMTYDGSAFEIEFIDTKGRTYALLPVPTGKLMLLHNEPSVVAA